MSQIGVILYDGVEPIDIGGTVGVISMASRLVPGLAAVTVAREAGPVRCAGGLTVLAAHGFDDAPECDAWIVSGGPGWRAQAEDAAMLGFLRRLDPARLASVCTGALILGAAGLLEGRPATTRRHASPGEEASPVALLARMGVEARPAQIVDPPGGPATGGGVSLAHDLTLHVIGRLHGLAVRDAVARLIEYDRAFVANRAALG
ncbi:DJ-1/PfpI family protein [Sabulicella glaciei]|uniref:DJ-1/PfpI family protein n=1 Tax=Sabulicella glaciei TaxID=2984948 RepID=A0ABT3P0W7_9PROT|nr:DJ-1/PfpI family protein [Roseococcus sp. MDT2-1-1]MCW8088064.1 DJ-1/PfpI family protein [Roseococcus sp. MDT2-1-1]